MKKILHIITGLSDGGAESLLYRFCVNDKNHKHYVISLTDMGKYGYLLENNGITVTCLLMSSGTVTIKKLIHLFRFIKLCNPDVLQTWMYHADLIGGVIGRIAGIENINWGVHHSNLKKGEAKLSTIFVAKLNALLSHFIPKNIIYCANKSKSAQEAIGYSNAKGIVIENGYDVSIFTINDNERKRIRDKLNIDENTFLIGHVGRYHPFKDHRTLIESFGQVTKQKDDVKCILVGSQLDPKNKELLKLLAINGCNNVMLLGKRNDIPSLMNAFDLLVLSSVSEAFPNVINEAMASGTPCVSTDVGDVRTIIGDTGWIVPIKNAKELTNKIIKAIDEKKFNLTKWNERKIACRNRIISNFNIDDMIKKYHHIWFLNGK